MKRKDIKHTSTKETYFDSLKCILTDNEKQELGSQMAEAVGRLIEHEKALKSVTTSIKSDIAKEEAIISGCSQKIRSGYDYRRVECEKEKDYEHGMVICRRLDTLDVIKSREMEAEERQKNLQFEEDEEGRSIMSAPAMQEI